MNSRLDRRRWLIGSSMLGLSALGAPILNCGMRHPIGMGGPNGNLPSSIADNKWKQQIASGLDFLRGQQSRNGHWQHNVYVTAQTALAGLAFICNGSTTVQGPYAEVIQKTVDNLISRTRDNGLIGDPKRDNRYTYGHGFAMLFLSQVLGEEEDVDRRAELVDVLRSAVKFSADAQTKAGGWGYVSAKDGNDFDEGSTTITQVQALRGCRNAGIAVPKDTIDRAIKYIYDCKNKDGGISYSSTTRGSSRPAITAAALATLHNAGENDSEHVPQMWKYCKKNLHDIRNGNDYGHWHYTYLYYSQVVYRRGEEEWAPFRDKLYRHIVGEQKDDGGWEGNISRVYTTSCNLIMLQFDLGLLPIFTR